MIDFYTVRGNYQYDLVKNDFTIIDNDQCVLQRLTNVLSVWINQWAIDYSAGIDYKTIFATSNTQLALDSIRTKIAQDPNVSGFFNFSFTFNNNILALTAGILINGNNYTITINVSQ
jgi:hypothetical protein